MELLSIASGSSGNCILVGSDNTKLLVDAGISAKRIREGLESVDLTCEDISGIVITHEHSDHARSLGILARKYNIPMYATFRTIQALKADKSLGNYDVNLYQSIEPDKAFAIGDIYVEANRTWHDAADPVCYCFTNGTQKISIATDLGDYNDYLVDKLKDSDALLIEANHDVRMLEVGPYPYPLKQRILSDHGHLSNERSGEFILTLLHEHVKGIILGHLSKENNHPDLAYETVKLALMNNEYTKDVRDFNLSVASRDFPSSHIVI